VHKMNLGADVTRIWEYRSDDRCVDCVKIVLRHNPYTKSISLSVGGVAQPGLQFPLGGGLLGRVTIEPQSKSFFSRLGSYKYNCFVSGGGQGEVQLLESNEKLKDLEDGVTDVQLSIPQVVRDGHDVVWYQIQARVTRVYHGETRELDFAVHRRFRDFRFAYSQICNAFRGTHMLSSVPKHPKRYVKYLEDHLAQNFLETRRIELENWLRRMLLVPRVAVNPDMEAFLGMGDPTVREVSVLVTDSTPLGVRLKKRQGKTERFQEAFPQAIVVDFTRDGTKAGAAEASGLIGVGDVVSKINGESVINSLFEEIVPKLKTTAKPMIVHFLGFSFANRNSPRHQQKSGFEANETEAESAQKVVVEADSSAGLQQDSADEIDNFVGGTPSQNVAAPIQRSEKPPSPVNKTQNIAKEEDLVVETSEVSVPAQKVVSPPKKEAPKEPELFADSDEEDGVDIFSKSKSKDTDEENVLEGLVPKARTNASNASKSTSKPAVPARSEAVRRASLKDLTINEKPSTQDDVPAPSSAVPSSSTVTESTGTTEYNDDDLQDLEI